MKEKWTKDLYCQFLLASQRNFTATQAQELTSVSHDAITRWLTSVKLTPNLLWEHVEHLVDKEGGVLVVDDSVIAKQYSRSHELPLLSYQYSGAYHKVVQGIGLVNLVLVDKENTCLPVDYRIFSKKIDGRTKHEHVQEMITLALHRGIRPSCVAFDSWYGSVKTLKFLEKNNLVWVTVLRENRVIDHNEHFSDKKFPDEGLVVHLKAYGMIKVFKTFSQAKGAVEYLATNKLDMTLLDIKTVAAQRWKIEEYHRGLKQTTGIEKCQARTQRSQRNHIFCSIISFIGLELHRRKKHITWYQAKQQIIQHAMRQYLLKPTISLEFG
ncbi:MAG: IS701 family transposase [Rhabdochlamydiaceae bacterium]